MRLEIDNVVEIPIVVFTTLAFVRPDIDTLVGKSRGDVVLGRERVAAGNSHIGATAEKRPHENTGLLRHVQSETDSDSLQWFFGLKSFANFPERTHVKLRQLEIVLPLGCEANILHLIIVAGIHTLPPLVFFAHVELEHYSVGEDVALLFCDLKIQIVQPSYDSRLLDSQPAVTVKPP